MWEYRSIVPQEISGTHEIHDARERGKSDARLFDREDPAILADPHPTWERLRRLDPLHRTKEGTYLVTRYADVMAVLRNPRCQRKLPRSMVQRIAGDGATRDTVLASLLNTGGQDHVRIRKLLAPALTPNAANTLRQQMARRVGQLLDGVAGQRSFDVEHVVARQLPVLLVAEIMGIADDDVPELGRVVDVFNQPEDDDPGRAASRSDEAFTWLVEYFAERVRRTPRGGLLRDLALAQDDGVLTAEQIAANAAVVLFAAATTYSNGLGNGMLALAEHPEQLQRLRQQRSLIPAAVEELCRYDSPLQTVFRWTADAVELESGRIERRRLLEVVIGSANRDATAFAQPDRLDVARRPNPHVGFGHGVRFCPGAHVARVATAALIDAVVERYSSISVASAPVRKPTLWDRGLLSLPLGVVAA